MLHDHPIFTPANIRQGCAELVAKLSRALQGAILAAPRHVAVAHAIHDAAAAAAHGAERAATANARAH